MMYATTTERGQNTRHFRQKAKGGRNQVYNPRLTADSRWKGTYFGLASSKGSSRQRRRGKRKKDELYVDPRTGRALTEQRLVHVIASDAMSADSLATAISVLGLGEGMRLVDGDKRIGARVASRDALGQVRLAESPVFRDWPSAGE